MVYMYIYVYKICKNVTKESFSWYLKKGKVFIVWYILKKVTYKITLKIIFVKLHWEKRA